MAVEWDPGQVESWQNIDELNCPGMVELPKDSSAWSKKRRWDFFVGRWCAAAAIDIILGHLPAAIVGMARGGAPVWPVQLLGSITHANGFAAATVARKADVRFLGIDTEKIPDRCLMEEIKTQVCEPDELLAMADVIGDDVTAFGLIFSAKESFYKAVHPHVGRFIDFKDVQVSADKASGQTLSFEPRTALAREWLRGRRPSGQYAVAGDMIHTACLEVAE